MNPAPTLLNDWVTNRGFWIFIGFSVFAGIVWAGTEFLKQWHEASVELSKEYVLVRQDVYDQELDPATDLGQWNQEMR